ncbi:LysR substrate-binding domain-containing protein [Novosphingobium sp. ST904]|uniref:LysR substrate-binding domain-containing protein n=1 Tax=Novosphingobium sp. ST904 TaxID=1684385 RepID=UPI0006C83D10|nr:LysR substrate-binding domain-containing protein [Novosphingobium sp. ST904]KPH66700.1 hypothetical protein ADT71_04560 [Novosphingobium sp. ST904]TCM26013.1 DNA-binding transcriptional LysR family regulator [Novosphingobium sp. ST904]
MAHETEPLISIKQLRAIVAVSEHASLVRASEQLAISQSSLSRQIADAEKTLGRKLFQRGWNGMEPTSFGAIMIVHARRMMTRIVQASRDLNALGAHAGDLSYHLNWFVLDVVNAVRRTGSASMAADYLSVSQPTISRTLAQAAAAIGQAPFIRIASGMAPTPCVPILETLRGELREEAGQIMTDLGALADQVTGRVAIGLLPFSEQDVVVEAFSVLIREHPHLRLQAVTGSYTALTDALRRGEIDLMLGPLRGTAAPGALRETPLLEEHLTIIARPGHRLTEGHAELETLIGETWVVGPHGTPTRQFFEAFLLERGMTPPAQICEMVTFPLAEKLVLESDAVGLLTYSSRQKLSLHERLGTVSSDFPEAVRKIGITWPAGHSLSLPQDLFLQVLQRCLPPES